MKKKPQEGKILTGNDVYEGYCIDLLMMIANVLKFNFTIHEVADRSYGSKELNGKWNGMVGELMTGVGIPKRVLQKTDS